MSNLQMLIQRFGKSPTIGVNEIAEILHLKPQTIRNKYAAGDLPFPVRKTGKGKRSPLVASIVDVARWLDQQDAFSLAS